MIVSIVFCFLMSLVITFFVLAGNGFSLISIFYGIFLFILYSGMTFSEARKKGSSSIFRRIFLITFAVLFCISFMMSAEAWQSQMRLWRAASFHSATLQFLRFFCHSLLQTALFFRQELQDITLPLPVCLVSG